MADPRLMAYPPIQRKIKLEILDEHQEMEKYKEENKKLQVKNLRSFF